MNHRGLTLLEAVAIIAVICILAAVLLPVSVCCPRRQVACLSNLQQLYKLGTVYAMSYKGEWPDATGKDLWLSFRKMVPPLIAEEHASLLHCSVLDHELGPDETNYWGPLAPFKRLGIADPLGGDTPGNHGEEYGGNVLFKDGSVQEWERDHPRWKEYATRPTPSRAPK